MKLRRKVDGVYQDETYKTTPYVKLSENIEARPITSRQRTGRAFLIDTFENYTTAITEKWEQSSGTIALATDYPKQDKKCMLLTTGTADGATSEPIMYVGPFPKGRFGFECEFQSNATATNIEYITFGFLYYDGTNLSDARVHWLGEANKKWQYKNSSGTYSDVTGGTQDIYVEATYQPMYHNVKVVVDFKTGKYVKLVCDDKEWDLSTLSIYTIANAGVPMLIVRPELCNATALAGRTLRVDNVILTDQEP